MITIQHKTLDNTVVQSKFSLLLQYTMVLCRFSLKFIIWHTCFQSFFSLSVYLPPSALSMLSFLFQQDNNCFTYVCLGLSVLLFFSISTLTGLVSSIRCRCPYKLSYLCSINSRVDYISKYLLIPISCSILYPSIFYICKHYVRQTPVFLISSNFYSVSRLEVTVPFLITESCSAPFDLNRLTAFLNFQHVLSSV